MEKHMTIFTYIASALSAFLWFLNENAAAIGVLIAFATFSVNWYYKYRESKRGNYVNK